MSLWYETVEGIFRGEDVEEYEAPDPTRVVLHAPRGARATTCGWCGGGFRGEFVLSSPLATYCSFTCALADNGGELLVSDRR